jgi:AcrR family transcriptional regulator
VTRDRSGPDLRPRARPRQRRARRTLEEILDAAGRLLEEVGLDAFNTNLLAERAGVHVPSVYRYFPNKLAVVAALAGRMTEEWDDWFEDFAWVADPRADWRRALVEAVERFYRGVRALPGGAAVRRAMRASPELRTIDQQDNEYLAGRLARALRARGAALSPRRVRVVARNLIETAVAVIDLAILDEQAAARMHLAELCRMQVSYLESLLAEGQETGDPT